MKSVAKKAKKSSPSRSKKPVAKVKKSTKAAKKAPKAKKAPPAPKLKAVDTKKSDLKKKRLQNPVEHFLEIWKPKVETFEMGLQKFLTAIGVSDREKPEVEESVREKLMAFMRKAPLSGAIEEQLSERFRRDRIHKFESIWSMKPKSYVLLNTLRADLGGFAESILAKELKIRQSAISPFAFEVGKVDEVKAHPAHARGLFEFQDESPQLAALLVNARPGHRILDLGAGNGDLALLMAMMMKNKGSLFVYDSDIRKLKIFKERATRMQIENYRILSDSQVGEVKGLDAVLIEAPSSSLGQLGAHPDLKYRFQREEIARNQKVQAALLREGARKLKLGGHLVYYTTTLNRSENEQQIEHFLKTTHNSYRLVPIHNYLKESVAPYLENFFSFKWDEKILSSFSEFDPYLVLSPDVHGGGALFAAVIQRIRIST